MSRVEKLVDAIKTKFVFGNKFCLHITTFNLFKLKIAIQKMLEFEWKTN